MSLSRFHEAQEGSFDTALEELRQGRKRSHWMWWIFPQLADLGRSPTAQHYAIKNLAEARAYLADPFLSRHLTEAATAILSHPDRPAADILGEIDALKLRSSATLFHEAGGGPEHQAMLDTFFSGEACPRTVALLRRDDA